MKLLSPQKGFTLLEILISVAIFALVSAATFSMLQQTIKSRDVFDDKASYLVELQRLHRLLQQDFSQIITRSIRDQYGDSLPPLMTEELSWGIGVELTRTGRANPLNKPRSDLLRLRYFLEDDKLIRRTWQQLDRAPDAVFSDQIVLQGVKQWKIRFFSGDEWSDTWPIDGGPIQRLPSLFEITIALDNQREFRWLITGVSELKGFTP